MDAVKLLTIAYDAKKNAYAPYSGFKVGAALLTSEGNIYTGCNIECASYGATSCAERTAIYKAVSEGSKSFRAIAIASDSGEHTFPCGICRQVIVEFGKEIDVIVGNLDGDYKVYNIRELLPFAFESKNIKNLEEI